MLVASILALVAIGQGAPPPTPPAVRTTTNLVDYFSPSWYPPEALRSREQGTVRFEVDVGRNGRASACRIVRSSGSRTLDEATCAIMMDRGRFTPARDATGTRVSDRFAARIDWTLPPQDEEPAEDARARANLASYVSNGDYPMEP